jgi:2TM domain-containing protein
MAYERPSVADQDLRDEAYRSLKKRRDFFGHLVAYVLVNALLIGIWLVSGAGFFWPIFVLLGWGIGLGMNAWDVYGRRPISEEEIRREAERLRR